MSFPYTFEKILGKGAWGEVYLVKSKSDGKYYALKKMPKKIFEANESTKRNLINEITIMQTLMQCKCDHVVKLEDVLQSNHYYYLIMEYCETGDLDLYLEEKKGRVTEQEAVEILMQILQGLKALHELLIIHRDLKPQNIFRLQNTFKIGDFGFSRQAENEDKMLKSKVFGSPAFMAPELLDIEEEAYNSKVDMWSLGVLFFYTVFKKYPFDFSPPNQHPKEFLFKVSGIFPNIQYKDAIKRLNMFLAEAVKKGKCSSELQDFFKRIFIEDPVERMEWVELYDHPLILKYQVKEEAIEGDEDLNSMNKMLKSINTKSQEKQEMQNQFFKKKNENLNFYNQLQQNENQLVTSVSKMKRGQQTNVNELGKSNYKMQVDKLGQSQQKVGQNEEDISPQQQENFEQAKYLQKEIITVKNRYIYEKDCLMFLQNTALNIVQISSFLKNLQYNGPVFCLYNYLYLKFTELLKSIQEKKNIYNQKLFDEFCKTEHYEALLNIIQKDYKEILKCKDYMISKNQSGFEAKQWQRIQTISNSDEFKDIYQAQLNKFLGALVDISKKQIKNIKLKVLKVCCYIGYSKLIDYYFAFDNGKDPEKIKYQIENMSEDSLLKIITQFQKAKQ